MSLSLTSEGMTNFRVPTTAISSHIQDSKQYWINGLKYRILMLNCNSNSFINHVHDQIFYQLMPLFTLEVNLADGTTLQALHSRF